MTSYDTIWRTFLNNCKVSDIELPQVSEKIYEAIKNASLYFNNRLRDSKIVCNDAEEKVDRELSDDHLLIIANYIRLNFLVNQKTYFQNMWQPFSSDVGLKNFNTQLKSIESSVIEQESVISRLIMNTEEDYL